MNNDVCILTFHNVLNYGALLQAFALQYKINSLGYNAEFINYINKNMLADYKILSKNKSFYKNIRSLGKFLIYGNLIIKKKRNNNDFINRNFKLTRKYYSLDELKQKPPIACAYICGSDQIWNKNVTKINDATYFLNFGDKSIKKISYAASTGSIENIEKDKDFFKDNVNNIDFVSVRENDAAEKLKRITNRDIKTNLDPTLLLTKDEWDKYIDDDNCFGDYILNYIVSNDDEERKIVEYISIKENLKVIDFDMKKNNHNSNYFHMPEASPLEFIKLIKNAKYVVTTSFHATVFSIIFNKKFIVVPHKKTGMRVRNLLTDLKLNDRIVYELKDLSDIYLDEIKYDEVNKLLEKKRNESIKWLDYALKKEKEDE